MLHPDAVFWPIRGIARLAGRSERYQRIANPGSLVALNDNTVLLDHEHLLLDHDLLVVPIDLLDEPSIQSAVQSIAPGYRVQLPKRRTVAGISHTPLPAGVGGTALFLEAAPAPQPIGDRCHSCRCNDRVH
jgi:hypothetical protein